MVSVGEAAQDDRFRSQPEQDVSGCHQVDGDVASESYQMTSDRVADDDDAIMEEVGDGSDDGNSSDSRGSLSDGKRPHHTFMNLIAMAIMSSSKKMMVLPEIYDYIQKKFPFYGEDNKRGWQNAVRHNLSLHDCFVKVPRYKVDAPTTSCYWRLSDEARDLYERGESLKRKGAYRRKGGPRGVCFRGPSISQNGGDPYAKQHLYSSSWRIRQTPNGGYPLRLDSRHTTPSSVRSPTGSMRSSSLDWSQGRSSYGFSPHDRQPIAASPSSERYHQILASKHRIEPQPMRSVVSVASHSTRQDEERRYLLTHERGPNPSTTSHYQQTVRPDQSVMSRYEGGRLTFDPRGGLRRFASDEQGRLCQVETFSSDRWRSNSRAFDAMRSQRRHSEMIHELCRDVHEIYQAVSEAMRAIAEATGGFRDAIKAPAQPQTRSHDPPQHQYYEPRHVTDWEERRYPRDRARVAEEREVSSYRSGAGLRLERENLGYSRHSKYHLPPVGSYC